jgi:MFS family permease
VFGGLIDEFKVRLDLTLTALIAGAVVAFAGTAAFFAGVVILFLWTLENYGLMYAWGSVAGVFGFIALVALIPLLSAGRKRRALAEAAKRRVAEAEAKHNSEPEWWQDPTMLLTGVQIARAVGIRRLLPILAVGAVVAGFAMSRQPATEKEPDLQPAE